MYNFFLISGFAKVLNKAKLNSTWVLFFNIQGIYWVSYWVSNWQMGNCAVSMRARISIVKQFLSDCDAEQYHDQL